MAKVFSNTEHIFYLRYIQENMKIKWNNKGLRDQVWKYERATTVNHFKNVMAELKRMNDRAHDWLEQIPTSYWSQISFHR